MFGERLLQRGNFFRLFYGSCIHAFGASTASWIVRCPITQKNLWDHRVKLSQNGLTWVSAWHSSSQQKNQCFCQTTQVSHWIIHRWKQRPNSSNKLSVRDSFPRAWVGKVAGNRINCQHLTSRCETWADNAVIYGETRLIWGQISTQELCQQRWKQGTRLCSSSNCKG